MTRTPDGGPRGGLPDLSAMLAQAQRAQAEVERAREALKAQTVEGRAGGGMVTATCDGTGELLRVRFESGLLAREEPSLVEDLVVAAVRDARAKAAELERAAMSRVALAGMMSGGPPGGPSVGGAGGTPGGGFSPDMLPPALRDLFRP